MPEPAFTSVERLRPSALAVALLHPLHYGAVLVCWMVLLMCGLGFTAAALLVADVLGLSVWSRSRLGRERLRDRAATIARRRAANLLPADTHLQWRELERLAQRTRPLNARRVDVDRLMSTYLNVALALGQARACVASVGSPKLLGSGAMPHPNGDSAPAKLEAQSAKRSEEAVARLEQQLATTAGLIRCVCEGAVAAHVDAAAGLWAADVDDASRALADSMAED